MRHRNFGRVALAFAASLAASGAACAQTASFVIVHGIPGRDVGPKLDPVLPVDVLVNGQVCLVKGLTFGQITAPFDVPAGSYTVAVSLANPISPCSNSAVISGSVTLASGEFGAVVAALSTSGAPAAEVYTVNVDPIRANEQRFMTAHAADAPPVEVTVTSTAGGGEKVTFPLAPGKEKSVQVPARPSFSVEAATRSGATIGRVAVDADPRSVILVFAVGSAKSGSATLLTKTIPDVF